MTQFDENWDDENWDDDGRRTSGRIYRSDRDAAESCSQSVVTAVANAVGRSPLDLEPLYHYVDPETLDRLVDRPFGSATAESPSVSFDFADYRVTVTPTAVRVVTDGGPA